MIWCVQFELAKWRQPNKIMVNRRRESNRKKSVWFCNVCNFVLHGIRTASCVGSPYSFFNTFNLRCHYQPQVTWKCRHKSKRHSTGTILDSQLVFQVTGLVSITSRAGLFNSLLRWRQYTLTVQISNNNTNKKNPRTELTKQFAELHSYCSILVY